MKSAMPSWFRSRKTGPPSTRIRILAGVYTILASADLAIAIKPTLAASAALAYDDNAFSNCGPNWTIGREWPPCLRFKIFLVIFVTSTEAALQCTIAYGANSKTVPSAYSPPNPVVPYSFPVTPKIRPASGSDPSPSRPKL